jgi:hypothetical protein
MARKILSLIIFTVLAVSIPAPIPSISEKRPITPESTQEQLAQQQALTGKVAIVGGVPQKVNEVGMAAYDNKVKHDAKGANSVVNGSQRADFVGTQAIVQSQVRLASEKKGSQNMLIWAIIVSFSGLIGWKLIQRKIEASTPVPELRKSVVERFS